jgi:hypothetical protein
LDDPPVIRAMDFGGVNYLASYLGDDGAQKYGN